MKTSVVLITGGSSGIGKATGIFLASQGCKVYGTTRNPGKYPDFDAFELLRMEVSDPLSIQAAVKTVTDREGKLDILINNAGMGITGPAEETPEEEVRRVFEVNFLGPMAVCKAVLPLMRRQGSGFIINITSIAGYMGLPFRAYYSASKGALSLITEALRMETRGSGIRICSLAPGDFATNIAAHRYHAPIRRESPYESTYRKSLELMDAHVSQGQDPNLVARKIYRILRKKRPAVHYTVGSPLQRLSPVLKRLLPDKLFEKLVSDHYKL